MMNKVFSTCLLSLFLLAPFAAHAQKMKTEEFVIKHLQAIGEDDTRSSITTRILVGEAVLRIKGGRLGETGGTVVMASEKEKQLISMTFGSTNYPHEKLGYDGKLIKAAYLLPGVRSTLGEFFISNPVFLREGLIGGALSTAWALYDPKFRNAKLEYKGLKKVDGKELHELNVIPNKGSDFNIKMHFDAEFRHVRTEYLRIVGATQGSTPEDSGRRSDTRYRVLEEFGDFKKESGLVLPHYYKMNYTVFGQGVAANQQEWEIKLVRFAFNQPIAPESYNTEAKIQQKQAN